VISCLHLALPDVLVTKTTTAANCDMCTGVNDNDDVNAEVTDCDTSSGAY